MEEPYKLSFLGDVAVASKKEFFELGISDEELSLAEASGAKLLIPEKYNSDKHFDVLPVVFSLAVVNQFNDNGDGMTAETALTIIDSLKDRPLNIEHKKDRIVGHMINASVSENQPEFYEQDIEKFRDKKTPFYITVAAIIYSQIYPDLADAIVRASDPTSSEYRSICTSWEIGFTEFEVVGGSTSNIHQGTVLKDFSDFDRLLCNGGKGFDKDGNCIRRVIKAPAYPMGAGLTYNPAAKVKGIYTEASFEALYNKPLFKDSGNKNISQLNKESVREEKSTTMDKEQFKEFLATVKESVASSVTDKDAAKSLTTQLIDALRTEGKDWKSEAEKASEEQEKAKASLVAAQEEIKTLKEASEASTRELTEIKQSVAEQKRVAAYEKRLQDITETYELNENELNIVSAEVNALADDETAFPTYLEKLEVFFAHKNKTAIAKKAAEDEAAKKLKTSTASKEDEKEDKKDDSADLETKASKDVKIPNTNKDQAQEETLLERVTKNLEIEVTY